LAGKQGGLAKAHSATHRAVGRQFDGLQDAARAPVRSSGADERRCGIVMQAGANGLWLISLFACQSKFVFHFRFLFSEIAGVIAGSGATQSICIATGPDGTLLQKPA